MCTNSTPAIVMPSSVACVKSIDAMRPGTCSCGKYTSLSGPRSARHSRTRRCKVRSCPDSNTPGLLRQSSAKMVFASSSAILVRHQQRLDLRRPHLHERVRPRAPRRAAPSSPRAAARAATCAPSSRSSAAAAAAASIVLFSIRFFLSKRTCLSLTIGAPAAPTTWSELSAPHRRTSRPHGRPTGRSSCRQAAEVVVADQRVLMMRRKCATDACEAALHGRPPPSLLPG